MDGWIIVVHPKEITKVFRSLLFNGFQQRKMMKRRSIHSHRRGGFRKEQVLNGDALVLYNLQGQETLPFKTTRAYLFVCLFCLYLSLHIKTTPPYLLR